MVRGLFPHLLVFLAAFITTIIATLILSKLMRRIGILGVDVHKLRKPKLPEMCGLAIFVGLVASTAVTIFILGPRSDQSKIMATAFILAVFVAVLVGVRDDLRPLDPRLKPLLTAAAALPILLMGAYDPHPELPFIGRTRLTVVYPLLLIPLAAAIPSNAVNMMNVFNGAMTGTCSIVSLTLLASLLLLGRLEEALLPMALLGTLLAFHLFNRYPARVFSGDTGDLAVGAAIGAIAVLGRIEVIAVVALMPHIMNAFYLLSTVGGLHERREMARPTRLLPDGRLEAVGDKNSPVTLSRVILAEGPMKETAIVKVMYLLTGLSSVFALLTLLITPR